MSFSFLVMRYTKNVADNIFDNLNKEYHDKIIYFMRELIDTLSVSKNVIVHVMKEENSFDQDEILPNYLLISLKKNKTYIL